MASDEADFDMQNLVDEVAEKCLQQLRSERAQADQNQLEQINALLEHWSEQSFERTKDLVLKNSASNNGGQAVNASGNNGFAEAAGDMRDRQSNLLAVRCASKLQVVVNIINIYHCSKYNRLCKNRTINSWKFCVQRSRKSASSLHRHNWLVLKIQYLGNCLHSSNICAYSHFTGI